MTTFEELIQKTTIRFHNQINKTCKPLIDHFGIKDFLYCKITNSGHLFTVNYHVKWTEYYYDKKLYLQQPHFRDPQKFKSGISLPKLIQNKEYNDLKRAAKEKFNMNMSLMLLNKMSDGLELAGFIGNGDSQHDLFLLSELPALRKFIPYFLKKNHKILEIAKEHQIDLKSFMGERFHNADIPVLANGLQRETFLKKIGVHVEYELTTREKEVLRAILNGYSASETAYLLQLSIRTVEHRVEKIKEKLVCFSKRELIQKAKELELFGYL